MCLLGQDHCLLRIVQVIQSIRQALTLNRVAALAPSTSRVAANDVQRGVCRRPVQPARGVRGIGGMFGVERAEDFLRNVFRFLGVPEDPARDGDDPRVFGEKEVIKRNSSLFSDHPPSCCRCLHVEASFYSSSTDAPPNVTDEKTYVPPVSFVSGGVLTESRFGVGEARGFTGGRGLLRREQLVDEPVVERFLGGEEPVPLEILGNRLVALA